MFLEPNNPKNSDFTKLDEISNSFLVLEAQVENLLNFKATRSPLNIF